MKYKTLKNIIKRNLIYLSRHCIVSLQKAPEKVRKRLSATRTTQMDFIDDFILEYKNNPCLWKADSAHFKNRTKRQEAYMKLIEVAAKHGEHYNVERTKQKINNLRCAFRHQLKKYTESKIRGEKEELYCPKRKYFESLLFLKDEETAEKNKKNTDTIIRSDDKSDDKIESQLETGGGGVSEIKIVYDKNKPDIISVQNLNEECDNSQSIVQNHSLNAIVALATTKEPLNNSSIIEYEEVNADSAGERDIVEHHISEYEKESSFEQQRKPTRRRKRSISMSSQQSMDTEMNSTKLLKVDVSGSDFEKLLRIACRNNQKCADDSFANFGQFVAHKLRAMEPTQAMYAEKIIHDVLFQGQVKLLSVLSVNQFGNFDCTQSPLNNNQTDK